VSIAQAVRILAAIEEHYDKSGLIIDLRGNMGGDFNVRRAIAEHLITKRSLVWRYVNRCRAFCTLQNKFRF